MKTPPLLPTLGVFGFDRFEPVILASLVSEDPLLLIGPSGTGKTYLLNSLSEALQLEHRHYNASLVAFDDLVGFPYPEADGGSIRFLQTPATVWGAQSILIDEISRCRPEHQNRLFSLIHERRVQGIALANLRYRWAAMNPCSNDQKPGDDYTGSEPLDPALADRFALFVPAADWDALDEAERLAITRPDGEGRIAEDGGALAGRIAGWRARFESELARCPESLVRYAMLATGALNQADVRISPRRARMIARSLLAAQIIEGAASDALYRLILEASLPQPCWGATVDSHVVQAAHRLAWDGAFAGDKAWIANFHGEPKLAGKLGILIGSCRDPDVGTQVVSELLASEPAHRRAAFAFAVYPAAVKGGLPLGAEALGDLGRVAVPLLSVEGEVIWQERLLEKDTQHPDFTRYARALAPLDGARKERARQFFNACLVTGCQVPDPAALETELDACVQCLREVAR